MVCSISCSMENMTPEQLKKVYEKCCGIASKSLAAASEKIVPERELGIKRELEAWFKSNDEVIAAMMDFNKYPFMEEPSDLKERKVFRRAFEKNRRYLMSCMRRNMLADILWQRRSFSL